MSTSARSRRRPTAAARPRPRTPPPSRRRARRAGPAAGSATRGRPAPPAATGIRGQPPRAARAVTEQGRQRVGPSGPAITATACRARSSERAKTVTQSSDRQAGTTPVAGMTPRVGLTPTMPFSAAGTRPEPAVSVPRARSTRPSATATAEPELEPPEIRAGSQALRTAPYGLRVPTRPVANWSRLVLPRTTAPAARSRATAVASLRGPVRVRGRGRRGGQPGHVDVVLDGGDQAGQRQSLAGGHAGVDRGRLRQSLVCGPQRDPDLRPVGRADRGVRGADPLDGVHRQTHRALRHSLSHVAHHGLHCGPSGTTAASSARPSPGRRRRRTRRRQSRRAAR